MPIALLIVAFLINAPAAFAKGPSGATIEGDGVKGAVVVERPGELGQGTAMSRLVEAVGFFELTFGESAKVSAGQPTKSLGKSRLVITWDMTDGDTIIQHIYHDAAGGPVAHMAPGQRFWADTATTAGGWFTITGDIATPLVELGVDETAVGHLLMKKAEPVEKAEPVKKVEPDKPDPAVAVTAAAAPTGTSSLAESSGVDSALIVAAVLLIAGMIGVGTWMTRRRPMPR